MSIIKKLLFYGVIGIITLLPFHAFLITSLNAIFWDSSFSPPLFLNAWKEIFLFLLILLWCIIFFSNTKNFFKKWDTLDTVLVAFCFWAITIGIFETEGGWKQILFGIKYDLFPLFLFAIFRKVEWTKKEEQRIFTAFIFSVMVIIFFGVLQKFLPQDFLVYFGYSPEHSHFSPERPLAYCQMVSETDMCRVQSFLSGPNQLGAFLLFSIPLLFQKFSDETSKTFRRVLAIALLFGYFDLFFSFSRSAWIGMVIGICVFIIIEQRKYCTKKAFGILMSLLAGGGVIVWWFFPNFFEKIIARNSSTQGHWERSTDGIKFLFENPWGLGLGDAGPASNRFAVEHLGFIPENWHLQIALETGFLGLFLYWTLLILVAKKLLQTPSAFGKKLFLGLVALSAMGIFLHSWESAETAYSFWILAGIACSEISNKKSIVQKD
jgi:hypothetical protein